MPFTITLTAKQRASLNTLTVEAQAAQKRAELYTLAIVEGADGVPDAWNGLTLTDAGLVLGDVPLVAPSEPPTP